MWWRNAVVGAVPVALLGVAVFIATDDDAPPDPVAVVEDFFAAIVDKDVDRALEHVAAEGGGVPVGEEAVFLHDDAIASGWKLLEASRGPGLKSGHESVDITIGVGGTKVDTSIVIDDFGGEWKLVEPFAEVEFPSLATSYLQVNDKVVEIEELYAHDIPAQINQTYQLFPGPTRFFGDLTPTTGEAEVLLPTPEDEQPTAVAPPKLTLDEDGKQQLQRGLEYLVDECLTLKVAQPLRCPFGVMGGVSSGDTYYPVLDDISWSTVNIPEARLDQPKDDENAYVGVPLAFDEPGFVTLEALGDSGSEQAKLTVRCDFSAAPLRVVIDSNGVPRVRGLAAEPGMVPSRFDLDTCDEDGDPQ